jgi:hypothetical protein
MDKYRVTLEVCSVDEIGTETRNKTIITGDEITIKAAYYEALLELRENGFQTEDGFTFTNEGAVEIITLEKLKGEK